MKNFISYQYAAMLVDAGAGKDTEFSWIVNHKDETQILYKNSAFEVEEILLSKSEEIVPAYTLAEVLALITTEFTVSTTNITQFLVEIPEHVPDSFLCPLDELADVAAKILLHNLQNK